MWPFGGHGFAPTCYFLTVEISAKQISSEVIDHVDKKCKCRRLFSLMIASYTIITLGGISRAISKWNNLQFNRLGAE